MYMQYMQYIYILLYTLYVPVGAAVVCCVCVATCYRWPSLGSYPELIPYELRSDDTESRVSNDVTRTGTYRQRSEWTSHLVHGSMGNTIFNYRSSHYKWDSPTARIVGAVWWWRACHEYGWRRNTCTHWQSWPIHLVILFTLVPCRKQKKYRRGNLQVFPPKTIYIY